MSSSCKIVDEVYEIYQSQIPKQPVNERERLSRNGVKWISNEDDDRLYQLFEDCGDGEICETCIIWRLYMGTLNVTDIPEAGVVVTGSEHSYEIRHERLGAFALADETRNTPSKFRVDIERRQ